MVQNILNEMGDPAQPGSLDRLLLALRDAFRRHPTDPIEVRNFLVALRGHTPGWFYNRLHLEDGQVRSPFWRSTAQPRGMMWCLLTHGKALFYPQGTEEHRKRYHLELVGERAARSWMGVPLRIGGQIVGAMAMEDDHQENVFQPEHFQLLCGLAERLAGVIETAWLNEQQRETNHLLETLQQASETITMLARRREDWLWHATLTLCTAPYGARFDRAMLFLTEPDSRDRRSNVAPGAHGHRPPGQGGGPP
ncbi:MAG: hypothetical protein KatS3mg050_4996 [Litorilinea sp.]|nr:MAG: hypothetical protein KatS3mg050_4996 [Litorilinea sp.]